MYLDLNSRANASSNTPSPSTPALSVANQVFMYLGTAIGVFFSSLITGSGAEEIAAIDELSGANVLISLVLAIVIMPIVYEKLSVNRDAPFIVQLGVFVQNGAFWPVLVEGIGKAI